MPRNPMAADFKPRGNVLKSRYLPERDAPEQYLNWWSARDREEVQAHERQTLSKLRKAFPKYDEPTLERLFQAWCRKGYSDDPRIRRMLSPITFIPNEILLQIFELYLCIPRGYGGVPGDAFADVEFAPWLLSQVCLEWRQLAFDSSSLWSTVRVARDRKSLHRYPRSVHDKNAALYLKEQPLDVIIDIDSLIQSYPELLGPLLPHRPRWKTLNIFHRLRDDPDTPGNWDHDLERVVPKVAQIVFQTFETELVFSFLENIRIQIDGIPSFHFPNNIYFPRLTKACLIGVASWPGGVTIPWPNLTELELPRVSTDELIPALPSLVNVRELKIGIIDEDEDLPLVPITPFPYLERLTMARGFAPLMDAADFPSLKDLTIGDPCNEGQYDCTDDLLALARMAKRQAICPVSYLHMILSISSEPPLYTWLSAFPALKFITVDHPFHEDADVDENCGFADFADALSVLDSEGNLVVCPSLERIVVRDPTGSVFEMDDLFVLLDMLEVRCELEGFNLKSVHVHDAYSAMRDSGSSDEVSDRMDELESRGLDLKVWY